MPFLAGKLPYVLAIPMKLCLHSSYTMLYSAAFSKLWSYWLRWIKNSPVCTTQNSKASMFHSVLLLTLSSTWLNLSPAFLNQVMDSWPMHGFHIRLESTKMTTLHELQSLRYMTQENPRMKSRHWCLQRVSEHVHGLSLLLNCAYGTIKNKRLLLKVSAEFCPVRSGCQFVAIRCSGRFCCCFCGWGSTGPQARATPGSWPLL